MTPIHTFDPTRTAALERIHALRPNDYARSRNAIAGAVSGLSPYITHGIVTLPEVLEGVATRYRVDAQHKFVYELGWREYFRHVWHARGAGILESLHAGVLPEGAYASEVPPDIRQAATGIPVVDIAVRTLYSTGYLHNHARMWLASYVVHIRKVRWRVAADWMYGHLLDGDLGSNHLSWQWVAGTGSSKPYLFNAENVARYAPADWHSPGSVVDRSYDELDRIARHPGCCGDVGRCGHDTNPARIEPPLLGAPPPALGAIQPDASAVAGRNVWLVHPWNLGEVPVNLPADTLVVGILPRDFHQAWPWSERRWRFVGSRLAALTPLVWDGDADMIGTALRGARQVGSTDDPHLHPWLPRWATCTAAPTLFPSIDRRCDSFSQWWTRVSRGWDSVEKLLVDSRIRQA